MSNDNLQMHQINSTSTIGEPSTLSSNPSTASMAPKAASVQFVSDSPITDPGQTTKVSETISFSVGSVYGAYYSSGQK